MHQGRTRLLLVLTLLLPACVPMVPPTGVAAIGTPAARVAAESFAAVLDPAGGAPLGAAVAVGPLRALTSAHVARAAFKGGRLRLQRGDGITEADAMVQAISDRIDLALLDLPDGFLTAAAVVEAAPASGEVVRAVGPHRLGRAIAAGRVMQPSASINSSGRGFIARLPVLMGYSGGPVLDHKGRLLGLTTAALDETVGAHLIALLAGVDFAGLVFGEHRRVFVLGIMAAQDESRRLIEAGSPTSAPLTATVVRRQAQ
jgi:S1-C subfamily serine protease